MLNNEFPNISKALLGGGRIGAWYYKKKYHIVLNISNISNHEAWNNSFLEAITNLEKALDNK